MPRVARPSTPRELLALQAKRRNEVDSDESMNTTVPLGSMDFFVRHRISPSLGGVPNGVIGDLFVLFAVRHFYFFLSFWHMCLSATLCLTDPQIFRILHPHLFHWSLGCCGVAMKRGFWHRRWRGLQAQVPRFLTTTTSFKNFEVDSSVFAIRIPSVLSSVASRSVYI